MADGRGTRGFSRSVRGRQRLAHLIAIKFDGTGTAAFVEGGNEMTFVDNGTGDYSFTFNQAFERIPLILALSKTADSILISANEAKTGFDILGFDATDGTTAKDVEFDILVWGWDDPSVV